MALKTSVLFSSGMFALLTYTAYFSSMDPWRVFYVAVPGALVAGILGYQIGAVLANPKGTPPSKKKAPPQPAHTPTEQKPIPPADQPSLSSEDTSPDLPTE